MRGSSERRLSPLTWMFRVKFKCHPPYDIFSLGSVLESIEMKDFLLLLVYPLSVLVIILAWMYVVRKDGKNTRISLKGLGITIEVSSTNKRERRSQEERRR